MWRLFGGMGCGDVIEANPSLISCKFLTFFRGGGGYNGCIKK